MRIMVFFDLPVTTREGRKNYVRFRKFLLKDGYDMLQFSIYSRLCNGMDNVEKHLRRMSYHVPPEGCLRSMVLTDKQFARMKLWIGAPTAREKNVFAEQLILL